MKKLFENKKGIIDDMMFWTLRIILIMVIVGALVFFVNSTMKKSLDTDSLEINLIASRIMNSKDCLAMIENIDVYSDTDVFRTYPGKIRLSNYDEDFLKKNCVIQRGNSNVGVKLTIDPYQPKYINKDYYDDTEPLTFSSKYLKVRKVFPVLVYDKDNKEKSTTIEIIVVAKKR